MRIILLLIIVLLAGAWFYPPYAEGTPNACAAFEKKISALVPGGNPGNPRLTALLGAMKQMATSSNGAIAAIYARDRFPQVPASLGCLLAYWKLTVNPDLTQFINNETAS